MEKERKTIQRKLQKTKTIPLPNKKFLKSIFDNEWLVLIALLQLIKNSPAWYYPLDFVAKRVEHPFGKSLVRICRLDVTLPCFPHDSNGNHYQG